MGRTLSATNYRLPIPMGRTLSATIAVKSINNKALIEELDKLLERLRIPLEYATCLIGGSFDDHVNG
ncbi:hypothetical protein Tco_1084417 [Tanacetum coccineum]